MEITLNLNKSINIGFLKYIFMPHFWLMNHSYDAAWDKKLNALLDEVETGTAEMEMGYMTVTIKNQTIWASNYPYAYAEPYAPYRHEIRPSRQTIERMHKMVSKRIIR